MPGVIRKRHSITHGRQLFRLGGFRLIVAVLCAKPGTPFLTVYAKVSF